MTTKIEVKTYGDITSLVVVPLRGEITSIDVADSTVLIGDVWTEIINEGISTFMRTADIRGYTQEVKFK